MKKTVLCLGLRVDQHSTFLRVLSRRFRILYFKHTVATHLELDDARYVEDFLEEETVSLDMGHVCMEMVNLYANLSSRIAGVMPDLDITNLMDDYQEIMKETQNVMAYESIFLELLTKVKVDLVVTNADYDMNQRPIVILAKERGIPTFNIEHGYFAHSPYPSAIHEEHFSPPNFASDYLNFDNEMERSYFSQYKSMVPSWENKEILALGTPLDKSIVGEIPKDEAAELLGLNPDIPTVAVVPTWMASRLPGFIQSKMFEVEFYRSTFKTIAAKQKSQQIQVIVKAHPAFSDPKVYPGWLAGITRLAKQAGLTDFLVIRDKLKAVLSFSHFFISNHFTSVSWDAFLLGKPTLVWLSPIVRAAYKTEELCHSNEMFEKEALIYVEDAEDMDEKFADLLVPERLHEISTNLQALKAKHRLVVDSAQTKSQRICEFLGQLLKGGERTKEQMSAA